MSLKTLPTPSVIEELDYEKIKQGIMDNVKVKLDGYEPLESDPIMAVIEACAYRELLLRASLNNRARAMLLSYATGADLDHKGASYGVARLDGVYPTANIEFSLTRISDVNLTIPKGTKLADENGNSAYLRDDVIILSGEDKGYGVSALEQFVSSSSVKCTLVQTPLPFLIEATQKENFTLGMGVEDDERFRERIFLSLGKFSTAGSKESYKYYALSSSVKVDDVVALNNGAGRVLLVVKSVNDEDISKDVKEFVNSDRYRPLTDEVDVVMANIIEVEVDASIRLIDMLTQSQIDTSIRSTRSDFQLGESVSLSYLFKVLHQDGVSSAMIANLKEDIRADEKSFVRLIWNLEYIR